MKTLATALQTNDVTRDEVLAFQGTEHYSRLKAAHLSNYLKDCHSVAKFYRKRAKKFDYDELVNSGYFGLDRAFDEYDPEQGAFSTYAIHWIKNEVRQLIRSDRTVEVKPHVINAFGKIQKLREEGLSDTEIQIKLNMKERDFKRTVAFMRPIASLNFKINKDNQEAEILDNTNNPLAAAETAEVKELMEQRLCSCLSSRDRKILDLRFRFENTMNQIAEQMNISVQRVQQILVSSIKKLHTELEPLIA